MGDRHSAELALEELDAITSDHCVVFDAVAFQPVPIDVLAHNSMMRDPRGSRASPSPPLPLGAWQGAVAECLAKGWLRCLDEAALQEIRTTLTGVELVCDDEAIPRLGDVDFTPHGARPYKATLSALREWCPRIHAHAARVVSRIGSRPSEIECYSLRPSSLEEALYGTREGWAIELIRFPVVSMTGPEEVGPWCARWWNRHPEGYRIRAVIGT
jgi:hypothetical protein